MEESAHEVLYEIRHHASRPYSSNYPPSYQQLNGGAKGSFLSMLTPRGVRQLKEKWREPRHPQKVRKLASLFVSPRGEHVAVASGNQITMLKKDDDYCDPCGVFTSEGLVTFTCGTWSESHEVLGVADDADTVYFIKANGEEITRITKKLLKASVPIIGLILLDDSDIKRCTFSVLMADGSLHDIEISQDPSASISSACTSNNGSMLKKHFPPNVFCVDFFGETSLFAVVSSASSISLTSGGNTGSSILSIWQRSRNKDLTRLSSTEVDGLYSKPKGYVGRFTSPKVLFSPRGKFVATLDIRGFLVTFKVDEEQGSLSKISCEERHNSSGQKQHLEDVTDFTWWSDQILTVAQRSGTVAMVGVLDGVKVSGGDPVYNAPILERVELFPGRLFLLESTSSDGSYKSSHIKAGSDLHLMETFILDKYNQFDIANLHWSLISFSERSVPEMYGAFISGGKYQTALEFADRHRLDKDEVLKSQWLHSGQGANEINIFLSPIKDQAFVLSECVNRVGPTEDAVRALLDYGLRVTNQYTFSESKDDQSSVIWDFRLARLKLLQFRDRLETFLGINMGSSKFFPYPLDVAMRKTNVSTLQMVSTDLLLIDLVLCRFSVQEYNKFRILLINKAAVALAESGKIGALNLLFKRHPYSLNPFMLEILAAIPETVPVQTYGQLLPGCAPPSSISLRDADWVECEKMVSFIKEIPQNHDISIQIRTEPIVKQSIGFLWPSSDELLIWYKQRARDIDTLSGQLDNCLCLVDFACRKGICELQQLHEDISYLHQLIYSDGDAGEMNFSMSLSAWEQLTDYERFKLMLRGVSEENVVERLRAKAIPFMQKRLHVADPPSGDGFIDNLSTVDKTTVSFLVRWMKEIALENRLDICSTIVEEGCREVERNGFFNNEAEVVDCALQCIYSCSITDRWSTMASMLSKLPQVQDTKFEGLKRSLKTAEGHIEAGRLLSFYQVPKPISFFQAAHKDGKSVKQILRLILSKFIRKQPGRSDNDWANMWRDLQSLQEKAFPFLDLEYMLMEFCRGLLKAGKFSLARNYLKGTGSVALATDKAENLVIQAAREFFFSASSLACSEIWKAKECLNIFPSSRNIKAEADIIDALTDKLPNLGVNILPLQFRQNKDPMEIIKLAITSQAGAYLNVDEIIEIAKLFGLSSQDEISAVQEAIAREAAVAGDLQLAFDLCLVLAKKGHGPIWDLCAALARGPALENMDISSRKQLLGFALSHCDDESIGELLNAWKDLDIQDQCETVMALTGTDPPNSVDGSPIISNPLHSTQDIVDLREWSGAIDGIGRDDQEVRLNTINNILSVASKFSAESGSDWNFLRENRKLLAFADLWLPWLLELSREAEIDKKFIAGSLLGKLCVSVRTRAVLVILSWLARNDFAPKDDLIAVVAKSIMKPPATEERDILGCSFLLNLLDAFHGVEIIEEQVRTREDYDDICSIMNVGMIYSSLHNSGVECKGPDQRRELLLRKFLERHTSLSSDEWDKLDEAQSSFWREWKLKLEEQRRVADHTRVLEQIIPGVEVARFLKGDVRYMENVVFSLTESVKLENKRILKDLMKLASTYGLDQTKVLLQYLGSISVSEVWAIDDIEAEISEFKGKLLSCAEEAINTISFSVYPAIDGRQKQRLSFAYGLLSDCFFHLEQTKKLVDQDPGSGHLYEIIAQECSRVSFIKELNFKNISGLRGLNLECFNSEVYAHVDEDLPNLYLSILETILRDLASGSVVHENLHRLVSSLSKREGDLEELKRVRQAVWARIAEFSDNLELPSQVRVYALELMQFVAAEGRNLKAFSTELQADVLPWEGWDSLQSTTANSDNFSDHGVSNVTDATTRFANTLVALKSSQLVSAISPKFEITPDNLLTVESAVSCFLKVSAAAISGRHCDALLAILREWEGLFTTGRDEAKSAESSDAKDNWGSDDWDEGWESFPEEPVEKETKNENTLSIHPLHLCWLEILKKLVLASRFTDVLKLIDQSITKMSGILLDEDGACNLNETLIGVDSFVALKMSMLLPYEAMQVQCLEAVEDKVKLGSISDTIGRDHEFLTLVLYSGVISTIITKSSLGSTFSCLCYMVGNFCRQCQEAELSILKRRGADGRESNEKGILFIFESVLFPCFISELVKADQQILAGFLVTKFMHTNPSLSLINVAGASLRKYLERQLQVSEHDDGLALENLSCCEPLVNTISILKGGLGNRIKSALSLLPDTVVR
ncbi:hypothetical protein RJ640_018283 [Escallonia rubra]|uniref:Sec39 domain-containing protein n=1 Tax=Escallonia rubra TaxID=112253 RepID=A0AA88U2R8_9ASTE|nr:hypothetical protein RJ640_018283 [Escallonia rubra]